MTSSAPTGGGSRLRALASAAYTASAGHLEIDPEEDTTPARRRWLPSTRGAVAAAVALLVLSGAVVLWSWLGRPGEPAPLPPPGPADEEAPAEIPALPEGEGAAAEETGGAEGSLDPAGAGSSSGADPGGEAVVVHVAGAVAEPGLVELPSGARLAEAVEAVGGPTPEADLAAVNLARPLVDGEQVYVPAEGEHAPPAGASGAEGAPDPDGPAEAGGVVDLNAADAAALETLPGIGPARAAAILEWRELNGGFRSVEDLLQVSGIGPATLERLRSLVTL